MFVILNFLNTKGVKICIALGTALGVKGLLTINPINHFTKYALHETSLYSD